jgi:hypothetical protein
VSNLHKHHRKLRAQGGDDSPANIMFVTPEMHTFIHSNVAEAYERGWLVKSWQDPAEVTIKSWPQAFANGRGLTPEERDQRDELAHRYWAAIVGAGTDERFIADVSPGRPPNPGETCPTCQRRVNHQKKPTSPESRVKSLRIPADDDTFDDDFARAMHIVGLTSEHKYVSHKFLRFVVDCIFRDEQEWAGAYLEGDA